MPEGKWPLIPDVAGLTKHVAIALASNKDEDKNKFDNLLEELELTGKDVNNIEDVLSFIRGMKEVAIGNSVRGFSIDELIKLEKNICEKIVGKLNVDLPDKDTPYHMLSKWISIDRDKSIEVFTTNYDLLLEQAFEELSIPYFDGFVGSRQSFFDLRAVEEDLIPKHWTRLWKIHGSINWFQKEGKEVFRSSRTSDIEGSHLIYPSHLKYDQSRKMPYLAMIDKLGLYLKQSNSLLIVSGYSFNDEHLNDTILRAIKSNPNTMVIALLFGTMTYEEQGKTKSRYPKAVDLALNRSNLAIWCQDEAIIGTVRGKWKIRGEYDQDDNLGNCISLKENNTNLNLGDYKVFGDFLQALIAYNQTQGDEE